MNLLPFFKWLEKLPASTAIRQSVWAFPIDQAVHLVALTVLAGAILVVDMRLLGRGFNRQPLARVASDAQPWLVGGLLAMVATGVPQLMSNAMKEYYSPYFWAKMSFLIVAVLFTFTLRRKVTQIDEARLGPVWGKVVGVISILLWTSVAVSGRLIGLLS